VGYIRRTGSAGISSFGFTPTWYHTWSEPEVGKQDTAGGDIFVAFMKDRLRVGLGTRDFNDHRPAGLNLLADALKAGLCIQGASSPKS